MKIETERRSYSNVIHAVRGIPKGKIRTERRPNNPVWQEVDGEVYMTCWFCGAINRITRHVRRSNGTAEIQYTGWLSEGCVTCVYCKGHNCRVTLKGWTGRAWRECASCGMEFRDTANVLRRHRFCPQCRPK